MFACFVGLIVLIIEELEISSRMVVNLSNLIIFTLSTYWLVQLQLRSFEESIEDFFDRGDRIKVVESG